MSSTARLFALPERDTVEVAELAELPLILPSNQHGLRALLNAAASRGRYALHVVAEIDGLAMLVRRFPLACAQGTAFGASELCVKFRQRT